MGNLNSRIKAWHNLWSWQFGGPVQNNNLEAPVTGVHFCVSVTSPFSLNRGTTFLRDWQNMRHKIILQYFGGHGPNASGFDHAVLHEIYSLVQIWKHLLPARQRKCRLFVPNHCRGSCQSFRVANCFQRVRLNGFFTITSMLRCVHFFKLSDCVYSLLRSCMWLLLPIYASHSTT